MGPIWESLRDNIWQGWGGIASILALGLAVVLFLLSRQRKELSYEVLTYSPLLSKTKAATEGIRILVDGQDADQVHLVELRVVNSGKVPIRSDEIVSPIGIAFDQNARVLRAEVFDPKPPELDAGLEADGNRITLKPILLNSRDAVGIRALVANTMGSKAMSVTGRIVGISQVKQRVSSGIIDKWTVLGSSFGVVTILMLWVATLKIMGQPLGTTELLRLVLVTPGVIVLTFTTLAITIAALERLNIRLKRK